MRYFKFILLLLMVLALIGIFGIVLPFLFSAKSTMLVLVGVVVLFTTISFGALVLNKLIGSVKNEEGY